MPPAPANVDQYLAAQPAAVRRVLAQVRRALTKALPRAEERISYGIPTYAVGGKAVLYFAGWKAHYAVYPLSRAAQKAFANELAGFDVEKSTVRFSYEAPVPAAFLTRLATFRAGEAPQKAKTATKKTVTKKRTVAKTRRARA